MILIKIKNKSISAVIISQMAESYIETLGKVDIININIKDYYCNHMIPFYRCLYKKMHQALKEDNKDILRQVALILKELNFKIDIMAYCIRE